MGEELPPAFHSPDSQYTLERSLDINNSFLRYVGSASSCYIWSVTYEFDFFSDT